MSWDEIVQKYIIRYTGEICKVTKPLRDHFGINYFTYHRIDDTGKYTVLVDRPDWAEHYVSTKIYLQDPYLRHPSVYESGLTLIESHGSQEYREQVMDSGKKVLNMDMGAILIQKQKGCVEFFGFSANYKTSSLQSIYLNRPQLLNSFAKHFKIELSPILVRMEREAGSLIELKGDDFFSKELISPDVENLKKLAFWKDLKVAGDFERANQLSLRERQCLKLLLQNRSAKESAAMLKLSKRTVEFYFENIKNKLDCQTKMELKRIAQTLEEGGFL